MRLADLVVRYDDPIDRVMWLCEWGIYDAAYAI